MRELYRTNDPVLLSWLLARLEAENVDALVFDNHASVVEGNIAAVQRRVMVAEFDLDRAAQVLVEAEEIARGERDPLD